MIFYLIAFVLGLSYAILLFALLINWFEKRKSFARNIKHTFSIIIPARDEANNIGNCIQSIKQNNYDCEIIVIDDHSSDETSIIASSFNNILVLINHGIGKKDALTYGIANATNEYIITLDADCVVQNNWLNEINNHLNKNDHDIITGPVKFKNPYKVSQWVEAYDFLALMAVTAYGIDKKKFYLANGANLIFKKEVFLKIEGYKGNENIASGDDVFLMNEANKNNYKIGFLKSVEGSVLTQSQNNLRSLLNQRKRWATKSKAYASSNILLIQGLVFIISLFIIIGMFNSVFCFCFFIAALCLLIVKLICDYFFLKRMKNYFYHNSSMPYFISTSILYLFLIIYMGLAALFPTTYIWKGRAVK